MAETLTAQFQAIAATHASRPLMLSLEDGVAREYSYEQLYQHALHLAHWLRQAGVKKGHRVGLILENRPEWAMCYFGIILAGAVAVPLDVVASPEILTHALTQTRAGVVFASHRLPLGDLATLDAVRTIVSIGGSDPLEPPALPFSQIMTASPSASRLPGLYPRDLASIIYTSGTTGLPKGVMLSHANFMANFASIAALGAVTPADNFLAILPLYHAFPFMATLLVPLFLGARITFIDTLKAEPILRCIKEQAVTILPVTPLVLQHFLRGFEARLAGLPLGAGRLLNLILNLGPRLAPRLGFDLAHPLRRRLSQALGPQFRYFICGGAKLPTEVALGFTRLGFGVMEGYGLTETAPVVSFNPLDAPRLGSVGHPLAGIEVQIDKPDAQGIGEILIQGANVMPGYYLNDAATREVITNGWFHSGDLGSVDADGYLYIQGRIKDIIVLASGKNISVEEVNQHYLQAPALREFYVLPDSRHEKLVAVAVPDFDYFREAGETDVYNRVKWYVEFYSQQLEPYKRVKDFVLTNQELPKTRLGKVKRYEVERIYQAWAGKNYRPKTSALEEELSPVGRQVVEVLLQRTGLEVIALADHLELDLGLDSLGLVEVMAALEEDLGIQIREEGFAELFTVAELIRFVEDQKPRTAVVTKKQTWGEILAQTPPPALIRRIGLEETWGSRLATTGLSVSLDTIFHLGFSLSVRGQEYLHDRGYIICPNHASFLDGFLIFSAVPWELRPHLFFMGTTFYFELPVLRDIGKYLKVIPVDSARHLVEAMQAASYVLRQGQHLTIFPEGSRSITGELRPIKQGVAILARELGVKLLPAFIAGSHAAWPPGTPLPRPHPIQVRFGPPCTADELAGRGRKLKPGARDVEAITLGLREAILSLQRGDSAP